jgi:hypothetical protein
MIDGVGYARAELRQALGGSVNEGARCLVNALVYISATEFYNEERFED